MTLTRYFQFPSFSPDLSEKEIDSIKKAFRYTNSYNLIDSIFLACPQSPILPFYLRSYGNILGAEKVGEFYRKLPASIQNGVEGLNVKKFLDRSILIKEGNFIDNFSMKDPRGEMISLQGISSKFLLLDFWASWCGPCRAENPALVNLYDKYKENGLEILGVSLDRNKEDWVKAIENDNLSWLHISDLKGWENEIAQKYKISLVPFMILLDSSKKVIALPQHVAELEKMLKELIK
jgi:thiol-disulfide isomerase/thioredoxin